jgi:hypothetical protein
MTVAEAISLVRTMLDEPKYEYYGSSSSLNATIIDALNKAASMVAKECWYRGEKEAIRPLWRETTATLDINQRAVMPEQFMFIESVRSNFRSGTAKPYLHVYVDPGIFRRRQMRNPSEGNSGSSANAFTKFVSRAEYTIIGGNVFATGSTLAPTNNKNVIISYIRVPLVSSVLTDQMPLAEYMHATICDTAAGVLYRKDHPGDNRPNVGGLIDVEASLYQLMRGQQK